MSATFDTINCHTLLMVMKDIVPNDELRLIRSLIHETQVTAKVNGESIEKTSLGNTGTPQSDWLSPVLFIVYLENAQKILGNPLPTTQSPHWRQGRWERSKQYQPSHSII